MATDHLNNRQSPFAIRHSAPLTALVVPPQWRLAIDDC
jgi:hypothetical protein